MNCDFDASSLFNLANGDVLDVVVAMPGLSARTGPQVRMECASISDQIDRLIASGKLVLLDDEAYPASQYLALLERYGLGPGETECLVFALNSDSVVCCDDRRARAMMSRELGTSRVTGTLGLLIRAVQVGVLASEAALGAYEQMRRRGGYLPEISAEDFQKAVTSVSS